MLGFYPRHPRGWRLGHLRPPFRSVHRFYPRHPRGWRPAHSVWDGVPRLVSIHATLASGDCGGPALRRSHFCFYPRHPRGWRRLQRDDERHDGRVSIHATLAGGDRRARRWTRRTSTFLSTPPSRVATFSGASAGSFVLGFYPRHPRGWRPADAFMADATIKFLSTPPSRVATPGCNKGDQRSAGFYPRHPRGWRQEVKSPDNGFTSGFYPRHPRGWRPRGLRHKAAEKRFYPRHPRGWRPCCLWLENRQ